jgi:hypothetical protein
MDHVQIIRRESVSGKEKSLNLKSKPVYKHSPEVRTNRLGEKPTPESV